MARDVFEYSKEYYSYLYIYTILQVEQKIDDYFLMDESSLAAVFSVGISPYGVDFEL